MLQPSELALDGGASVVEAAPPARLARNEWPKPIGSNPGGLGGTLPRGAAPLGALPLEVRARVRPCAVLAGRRAVMAALHVRGLPERDDRSAAALLTLRVDTVVVVAHIERDRRGREAASAHSVEEGSDEKRLVLAG